MNIAAFASYMFLTAFTPGPNNIMAMSNSAKLGFRRGLVFCAGVFCGFLLVMSLCALFTSLLYQYIPVVAPVMKWIGAGYILFLAFSIVRDKPHSAQTRQILNPGSLLTGMVLQFVNVKCILYGITAFSTFILPHTQAPPALALAVLVLSAMGFAGTACWALFGSLFQRFFEQHRKLMNAVMALLLVYCALRSVL